MKYGLLVLMLLSSSAFASKVTDLSALHKAQLNKPEYIQYLDEFIQYNNYLGQDNKNNCYPLGKDKVTLYFEIRGKKITDVVSESDTPRSNCFKNNYLNLPVKAPPITPLIIKLEFN